MATSVKSFTTTYELNSLGRALLLQDRPYGGNNESKNIRLFGNDKFTWNGLH